MRYLKHDGYNLLQNLPKAPYLKSITFKLMCFLHIYRPKVKLFPKKQSLGQADIIK